MGNDRTYGYDKNGNVISTLNAGVTQSLNYDYRNNLIQSAKGSVTTKYSYDSGYGRIKKWNTSSNDLSLYLGDYEIEGLSDVNGKLLTTNIQRINIALGKGQSVSLETVPATNVTSTIYHHTDHLTGAAVDTDQGGYLLQVQDYLPFGSQRVDQQFQSYKNKKKFTGKELDTESGLYYYGARYYDSDIGRWMGVDPVAVSLESRHFENPQKLNGYNYSLNNPIKLFDPDGNEEKNPIVELANTILTPIVDFALAPVRISPDPPEIASGQYKAVENQSEIENAFQNATVITGVKALVDSAVKSMTKAAIKEGAEQVEKSALQEVKQLQKGVKSLEKQILKHEDKIKNPVKYVVDFFKRDKRYQEGLIRKWQKEINTFKNEILKKQTEIINIKK